MAAKKPSFKFTKKQHKTSLNIKIPSDLDARLKRLRTVARQNDDMFNVSVEVTEFLEMLVTNAEKEYNIKQDINEFKAQQQLVFNSIVSDEE